MTDDTLSNQGDFMHAHAVLSTVWRTGHKSAALRPYRKWGAVGSATAPWYCDHGRRGGLPIGWSNPPRPVQISSRTTDQLRSRTSPPGTPKGEQATIQAPGNFPGSVVWLSDCDVQKQTTSITICVRHGSRQGSVGSHQELSSPRQACRLRASGPDRLPSGPAPAARTILHFLALHATAHTVPSTKGPRLGLQPVLHKEGGIPLGDPSEQKGPLATERPGLHPRNSALRWGARVPLGKQTEQEGPKHPHSTPVAHSRKASVTHWTLAPTTPHGNAP
jgi:hypothetical protein